MAATLTDSGEQALSYWSFPIEKTEETADGNLIVYGKATDSSVDSDGQIVDLDWSGKALDEWKSIGNIRVQHQAQRDPAGKAIDVFHSPDAHYVKSLIVEPVAKNLVRHGVLTAYSVGIARPVIEPDISGRARNGIIKGGVLVELSLVDRPANKNCGIQLVKMADSGKPEWVEKVWGADLLTKSGTATPATADSGDEPDYDRKQPPGTMPAEDTAEADEEDAPEYKGLTYKSVSIELPEDVSVAFSPADLAKLQTFARQLGAGLAEFQKSADTENAFLGKKHRKFSASRRRSLASSGHALPDGSYPIPDADALRRAAILARSGHGNVAAARRLISRRAKELGVPNPLSESDAVKKDEGTEVTAKAATCDVCKGTGMVDGKKCMKCAGMKSDDAGDDHAEKAIARMDADDHDTDSDSDEDDKPQVGKGSSPAAGVVGMHTDPLPSHREPDGKAIESLEHDAGLPTVPDSSVKAESGDDQPEMQAALRLKSLGVPHQLGMLHDMSCPAFSPEDVAKAYPGASFASLDISYFAQKALDAAAGEPMDVAARTALLWNHAQSLKGMTIALVSELQEEAHKAFRDANPGPGSFPTPGHISPQRFNRGSITAGHAAESPGSIGQQHAVMPSGQISASQFGRGFISDGHAADSPANKGTGVPERVNYVPTIKDVGRSAMRAMHDHIAQTFPDVCSCGPEHVQSIASRPVPVPQGTPSTSALKTAEPDVTGAADPELEKAQKKLRKKMGKRVLSGKMTVDEARAKIGRRVAQKAGGQSALSVTGANAMGGSGMKSEGEVQPPVEAVTEKAVETASNGLQTIEEARKSVMDSDIIKAMGAVSPDAVKSAVAEALAPVLEKLAEQQKLLDALADQPDPNLAPYRGVAQNPVKTASARPAGAQSVAEIAERTQVMMLRELENQWRSSPDPAQREAAWRSMIKLRGINPA